MKQYPIKRISIISIISFVGILLMQAFWIVDSYQERKAHFAEHIHFVLDHSVQEFCSQLEQNDELIGTDPEYILMANILETNFDDTEKMPPYTFVIKRPNAQDSTLINQSKHSIYSTSIDCGVHSPKKLILLIRDNQTYYLGSILGWVILSSFLIFIGIIALLFNISFVRKEKKTSKIQSDFIGNMTHELKTPIATISVASEMLMKDRVLDNKEKSIRYSKIIFEENLRLKKLVDRVMQIALFENGTMRIKLANVDLHDSIIKSGEAINMIIEKQKGNIELELKADNSTYKVDSTHFSNIITNLLENAIKYSTDQPQITVSTTNYSEGILISISDQGIGIPRKYQDRIFDRFFRVQNGDVHNTNGFGLGLYYVRRVVEAHGGTIKVYSELGKGSRFEIFLARI